MGLRSVSERDSKFSLSRPSTTQKLNLYVCMYVFHYDDRPSTTGQPSVQVADVGREKVGEKGLSVDVVTFDTKRS